MKILTVNMVAQKSIENGENYKRKTEEDRIMMKERLQKLIDAVDAAKEHGLMHLGLSELESSFRVGRIDDMVGRIETRMFGDPDYWETDSSREDELTLQNILSAISGPEGSESDLPRHDFYRKPEHGDIQEVQSFWDDREESYRCNQCGSMHDYEEEGELCCSEEGGDYVEVNPYDDPTDNPSPHRVSRSAGRSFSNQHESKTIKMTKGQLREMYREAGGRHSLDFEDEWVHSVSHDDEVEEEESCDVCGDTDMFDGGNQEHKEYDDNQYYGDFDEYYYDDDSDREYEHYVDDETDQDRQQQKAYDDEDERNRGRSKYDYYESHAIKKLEKLLIESSGGSLSALDLNLDGSKTIKITKGKLKRLVRESAGTGNKPRGMREVLGK